MTGPMNMRMDVIINSIEKTMPIIVPVLPVIVLRIDKRSKRDRKVSPTNIGFVILIL